MSVLSVHTSKSLFDNPIEELKYVGKQRGLLYRKLGVTSIGELITYYPRDYDDLSEPTTVFSAIDGETCCIKVKISSRPKIIKTSKDKMVITCTAEDETGVIKLTFFNNKFITNKLVMDKEYLVYGKVICQYNVKEMQSPQLLSSNDSGHFLPIYSLTSGLTNNMLRRNMRDALGMLPSDMSDTLPEKYKQEYHLTDLFQAITKIHFPITEADVISAKRRLIFDELLHLSLGLKLIKDDRSNEKSINIERSYLDEYLKCIPFELTNAQLKAINTCMDDMLYGASPMGRLIQGDVGSGKTCVAIALCHSVIRNGYQCAFMAPTEILAEQHYNVVAQQLESLGIKVALLTGSTSSKRKKEIKDALAVGQLNLVIGTHALLTENVVFKNLLLAVTDEQHRFGVSQRAELISKGCNPHFLIMSATPIPRTLAMMLYGDLDISVIDELPKGRQKINTYFIDSKIRVRALNFIKKHIDSGSQAYIVCPSVEDNDNNIASVISYYEKLKTGFFKDYSIALLHGKMKPAEKENIMSDFSAGKTKLLIATTVVEVGVDVPNATVIMVENSERFGLSQLHQLRGRVGRGNKKSYCILVSDTTSDQSKKRLNILCQTTDGFKIADADLKLRGPGDFFGSRQSGLPLLSIASLSDSEMFNLAMSACEQILNDGIEKPMFSHLRAEIKRMFSSLNKG